MFDAELAREILVQILDAAQRAQRRSATVQSPKDFLKDDEGLDRLDAICMMLIAIGESLKNLDKITDGSLLARHPEVDWKGAKGIRDIISHHYFDVNAEVILTACRERLPGLIQAVKDIRRELENG